MHLVETEFVLYIKKKEHTGSKPKRKPKNIDEAIAFVFQEIPECDFEVTFDHDCFVY